jgi:hypothetical protein
MVMQPFEGYQLHEEVPVPGPLRAYACSRGDLRGVLYVAVTCDASDFVTQLAHYRALDWHALVPILDGGVDDRGLCWIVTESPGQPIAFVAGREALAEALDMALELVALLGEADERGLHHGDLGLDVLHRDADGALKISRFGHLRLFRTEPRLLASQPRHRAPEVLANGYAVSFAADVYSLGELLREITRTCMPDEGSLPPELRELLENAAARDPDARFSCAEALFAALREASMALAAWTPTDPAPRRDTLQSPIEIRSPRSAMIPPPPLPSPSPPAVERSERFVGHTAWMVTTTALAAGVIVALMMSRTVVVLPPPAAAPPAPAPSLIVEAVSPPVVTPASLPAAEAVAPPVLDRRSRSATERFIRPSDPAASPAVEAGPLHGDAWYRRSAARE